MDALSEALNSVRMTGAIFYHAECTAPWGFRVPHVQDVAHVLAPGTERLVSYHLVTEGKAIVRFPEATIPVSAGDVLIIPHGDAHTVSNGSPSKFVDSGTTLGRFLAGDLTRMRLGGGGETTRFVCGYFGCERHADKLFLAGLPLMIRINIRGDSAGEWLENSVRHLVSEAGCGRPGQSVLLSKMAEALFIETLRRYMERLPAEQTGWLAGARDAVVGSALALMHKKPFHPWTLPNWPQKPEPPGRFSRSGLRSISASRRWPIWRAGDCSSRQGCSKRHERRCCRWHRRSGTIQRRLSTGRSSASLAFRPGNSGSGHRDPTRWTPGGK